MCLGYLGRCSSDVHLPGHLQVYGDLVRVLRAHPGQWQAYVGGATGGPTELMLEQPTRPTYQQVSARVCALCLCLSGRSNWGPRGAHA